MKSRLLNFYFFVLFLYTVTPTPLFSITELTSSIFWAFIPMALSVLVAWKTGVRILNMKVVSIWLILLVLSAAHYYNLGQIPSPYPFIVVYVAYVAINVFKNDFIDRFINLSYILTIVDLVLWGMTLISYNQMLSIANSIGVPAMGNSVSLYIYSININVSQGAHFIRNAGYCWEPGRYACFLCLSIYFCLLKNGNWLNNKKIWVFVAALITTASTTGFSIFLIMLIMIYVKGNKYNPLALTIVGVLVASALSLPFMREKIVSLFTDRDDIMERISQINWIQQERGEYVTYVPQRFEGLMFQYMNFIHMNPLFGEGRNHTNYYINRELGLQIAPSEGLMGVCLRYGLIIAFFIYMYLFKTSKYLSDKYNLNNKYLLFVIILLMSVSYNFWENPLIACLWLFPYFNNTRQTRVIISETAD